jgi:DNA-binding beta-propeller fold protein YncE
VENPYHGRHTFTNHRVQCFSPLGKYLYGQEDLAPGGESGRFHTPHGLAFDSAGHLYVVDSQNQRVRKFAVREP